MLNLKLQYFGHLMRRVDSLKKPLTLGGIRGKRRRGRQRMRWLEGITNSMGTSSGKLQELVTELWTGRPGVLQFMGSQRVRHGWATELNWSHLYYYYIWFFKGFFFFFWYCFLCARHTVKLCRWIKCNCYPEGEFTIPTEAICWALTKFYGKVLYR